MTNTKSNIIRFPVVGRSSKKPDTPSPGAAFLDAVKMIQDAPALPSNKTRRGKSLPSQSVEGDNNTQVAGERVVHQSIKGSGNVQIGGAVGRVTVHANKAPRIEIAAPFGSIGADPAFRARIESLIKQINEYRHKRLGKSFKFGALYGELAKAFGLAPKSWRDIWLFDESMAPEVIHWLEAKLNNTQQGRIDRAARGEAYMHTRGHLFKIETDYLAQLGWNDDYATMQREIVTGKESRRHMTDAEFRHWVGYLRRALEAMYGESTN
ncbi:hypothetical protein [Pusillimonas noertemannii]|uniref:Uncharacterized protein n=1 Tax=Pusillimonas noertemannii TaxID=305977 RepID=A0A2U1CMR7_9BURK|nr:hypothetical protein [Pusillimonas noertemannii]NYT68691.1 hypothetical protein [Pusillimonas noertemannii]PVY62292.1 hypothetical protein C7440_1785 [Pusillimonas noertemannii]TFL10734.1 hypothetical protein CSC72_09445 [Pusillimonas noertemannii]